MRVGIKHLDLVNYIMRHPANYGTITDDYSPPVEEFSAEEALLNPSIWFIYPTHGVLFVLHPHNGITYEVHVQALPEYRGKHAVRAAKDMFSWMFHNSPMQKAIANIPNFNRPCILFAKWAGMSVEGTNRKSFLKHGKLYDQTILGLCKEDF